MSDTVSPDPGATAVPPDSEPPAARPGTPIRVVALVLLVGLLLGVGTLVLTRTSPPPARLVTASGVDVTSVVQGNSAFALDLFRPLRGSPGNLFFSPYSVSTALAMAYAGARGNTQQQMAKVLHFPSNQEQVHLAFAELQAGLDRIQQSGDVTVRIANSLWAQQGCAFLDAYVSLAKTSYGCLVAAVDYGDPQRACRQINQWVEQQTAHRIRDLLTPDSLDASMALVLVNAVYFKGKWEKQFSRSSTSDGPFHLTRSDSVLTPMMRQFTKAKYAESGSVQMLELPYVGNAISMLVLLPRAVDGLDELETNLSSDKITAWRARLQEQSVQIFLPRFTMTTHLELGKVLQTMGMTDAFHLPSADFTGVTGKADLFITAVLHQAFVETNEEGTEATAATALPTGRSKSSGKVPPTFLADHPFLFLIQENRTGSILFLGRVSDPTKS